MLLSWNTAFKSRSFTVQFLITLFFLALIAFNIPAFFVYVQARPGRVIYDPILNLLPAINLSGCIFLLIYSLILFSLFNLRTYPLLLLKGLQAYGLLTCLRVLSLFLLPLEAPAEMIALQDPFTGHFFYGRSLITKDLFFSGHVSVLYLLFLIQPKTLYPCLFLLGTLLTGIALLIQHAHYSIDVLAGPVFSWLSFRLVELKEKFIPAS